MKRAANLAATAVIALSVAANAIRFWLLEARLYPGDDFRFYYSMARVGLTYGWHRIYDLSLQCQPIGPIQEGTKHCPALALPPVAWLAVPFTYLPYPEAYLTWMAMLGLAYLALLAVVWPRLPEPRLIYAAAAVSCFPLAYCLFLGQVTILAILAVALAWRLIGSGHSNWAGAALILTAAKPQAVLLVPIALAVSGTWRPLPVFGAGAAVLAGLSLVAVGPQGLAAYLDIARSEIGWEINYAYTLAGVLGRGVLTTTLQALLALLALAAAWRLRRNLEAVFIAGLLGSALFSPYWHFQDYVVLILAAILQLSLGPRLPALVITAAVIVVESPLLAGAPLVPPALQVGSWLALEILWLLWLVSRPQVYFERVQESTRREAPAPSAQALAGRH
jgi:hypothetical protein